MNDPYAAQNPDRYYVMKIADERDITIRDTWEGAVIATVLFDAERVGMLSDITIDPHPDDVDDWCPCGQTDLRQMSCPNYGCNS